MNISLWTLLTSAVFNVKNFVWFWSVFVKNHGQFGWVL